MAALFGVALFQWLRFSPREASQWQRFLPQSILLPSPSGMGKGVRLLGRGLMGYCFACVEAGYCILVWYIAFSRSMSTCLATAMS